MTYLHTHQDFRRASALVLPVPANVDHRFHIVHQPDLAMDIPMRLTVQEGLVREAEIPGSDGRLVKDYGFYMSVVNNRAQDAWPEVSEEEFKIHLDIYKKIVCQRKDPGMDLTIFR